ncbi:hypothetical protein WN943_018403 [Citrus x changshan-huyou]
MDSANSEEVNHAKIGCSDRLEKIPPRRKQLKKANMKRSISSKLTKQLHELCEAVKNNPRCSVQEILDKKSSSDSVNDINEQYLEQAARNGHNLGNRMVQEKFQHSSETDCIEAIDGTHIFASLSVDEQIPYMKARCKILQHMPNFKFDKQVAVVAASMTLHSFIRRETIADLEFESYEGKEDYIPDDKESSTNINVDENEASEMGVVCENIARELMLR